MNSLSARFSLCVLLSTFPPLVTVAHAQRTTAAQIQNFMPNARAFAMGGAFTAVARDEWAVWWNPAALGERRQLGLSFAPPSDLVDWADVSSYSVVGAVAKSGLGGGVYLGVLDEPQWFPNDNDIEWGAAPRAQETAIHLAAGADITALAGFADAPLAVSVGAAYKHFDLDFAPEWGSDQGGKGSGHDADLAVSAVGHLPLRSYETARHRVTASYAYVHRNLFDRSIEYVERPGVKGSLGTFGRVGVATKLELACEPEGARAELTLAFDREASPRGLHEGSIHHYGAEVGLFGSVYGRYGVITHPYFDTRREMWGVGLAGDRLLPQSLRSVRARVDFARGRQVGWESETEQLTFSIGLR